MESSFKAVRRPKATACLEVGFLGLQCADLGHELADRLGLGKAGDIELLGAFLSANKDGIGSMTCPTRFTHAVRAVDESDLRPRGCIRVDGFLAQVAVSPRNCRLDYQPSGWPVWKMEVHQFCPLSSSGPNSLSIAFFAAPKYSATASSEGSGRVNPD